MKKLVLVLSVISLFFASCSKDDKDSSETLKQKQVFDQTLNCYVPENFYEYDYILVKELPDPKTLVSSELKSGSLAKPEDGGQIVDSRQIPFINSSAIDGIDEVSKSLTPGYVVTGIATMINSARNYCALMLEYRYIYPDGTMSSRYRVWDTDRQIIQPTNMEAWIAVPTNSIFTGFGIRGTSNVDYMTLFYRALDPASVRLTGSECSLSGGLHPGGSYDKIYKPEENGLDMDRAVLLGIALMASDHGGHTTG